MRRRATFWAISVLVAAAALLTVAMTRGDGEPPSRSRDRPAVERLRGDYSFEGRRRRVDVEIAAVAVKDPWHDEVAVVPAGSRLVGVSLRFLSRGANAFPNEWATFQAVDEHGRGLPGPTIASPLRKRYPARRVRGQPLSQVIAFIVPDGRRLGGLRMTSTVELWPFRASWRLRSPA